MKIKIKSILFLLLLLAVSFTTGSAISYMYSEPKIETQVVTEAYELNGWELLTLAIIKTESDFNATAVGTKQDLGVMQITPVYVAEANRILGEERYTHIDAFDVKKSIEMFHIVQGFHNPEHDVEKAINLHNPGGNAIGYAEKVLANYRYLLRVEEIRKQVIDGN